MSLIWVVSGSLESMQYLHDLEDEQPPRFDFANQRTIHRWLGGLDPESSVDQHDEAVLSRFNGMPKPVFRIVDPAFRLDYFRTGIIDCASLRLRCALGLTDAVIRYRDIDVEQSSSAAVPLQEYQAFHVMHLADPIDWSRTAGQLIGKHWFLAHPNPGQPRRIFWRDDFVPPAPLFRAFGAPPWMLATDALADSVMRAGITDLVFQDVTSDELLLRQL